MRAVAVSHFPTTTCSNPCSGTVFAKPGWIGSITWTVWTSPLSHTTSRKPRLAGWLADGGKGWLPDGGSLPSCQEEQWARVLPEHKPFVSLIHMKNSLSITYDFSPYVRSSLLMTDREVAAENWTIRMDACSSPDGGKGRSPEELGTHTSLSLNSKLQSKKCTWERSLTPLPMSCKVWI